MDSESKTPLDFEGVQLSEKSSGIEQQPSYPQDGDAQDEAMAAFKGIDEAIEVDEATDRRLLRKIDMILMPVS